MADKKVIDIGDVYSQIQDEVKLLLENRTHAAPDHVIEFAEAATLLMGEVITAGRIDLIPKIQMQLKVIAAAKRVKFSEETNQSLMNFAGQTIRILGAAIV